MTLPIVAVEPRSTWIHCGSLKALDQRVPVLPSTALAQGVAAFSVEEQVTGLFSARLVLATDVLVTVGVLVRVAVGPTGVLVRVAVKVAGFVGPLVPEISNSLSE